MSSEVGAKGQHKDNQVLPQGGQSHGWQTLLLCLLFDEVWNVSCSPLKNVLITTTRVPENCVIQFNLA